ncbi:DUF1642 domain-containing protein [Latilactobacillus sakei]
MNKKVKLPKFMCDWLDQHKEELCGYPMTDVSKLSKERDTVGDVGTWLFCDTTNQWKLIDALRYGYEPEPEPRWGIKAGSYYLNEYDTASAKFTDMQHAKEFGFKSNALYYIGQLGFGEVVDLNKEDKADG